MKNIVISCLACMILSIGINSFAEFTGSVKSSYQKQNNLQGGVTTTVANAKNLSDDSWVCVEGKIIKQINRTHYTFQDGTGEITLEIKDHVWNNQDVSPDRTVRLYGEIDQDMFRTSIEVKKIEIVSSQQQTPTIRPNNTNQKQ